LPALKAFPVLTLLLIVATTTSHADAKTATNYQLSSAVSTASSQALAWLSSNHLSNGSYGPYSQIGTAPAAYALWLNNSQSLKARASFTWLASEFDDGASGIWYEADLPGEILYTLSASKSLGLLSQPESDYDRLLGLRDSNGSFKGFSPPPTYVPETSSVDTAMALLGLINASAIRSDSQQSATDYLSLLQNQDGSFNLTTSLQADPIYSLGPDPVAITALVTLALKAATYTDSNPNVSKGLTYLAQAATANFTEHVYAAALSGLAFAAYGMTAEGSKAISFLVSSQNSDGGYRDIARYSSSTNPLDTGWAAIALQLVRTESEQAGNLAEGLRLNPVLIVGLIAAGVAMVVAGVSLYRRRTRPPHLPALRPVP